jgi:hypothetical protein
MAAVRVLVLMRVVASVLEVRVVVLAVVLAVVVAVPGLVLEPVALTVVLELL